jgi:hypothetical protein
MIGYAVRGVPLRDVAGGLVVLVLVLGAIVEWHPVWRGLGLAVVVLVAEGAWVTDEPAAAVVDTTPRDLRWRTVARLTLLLPAATTWLVFVGVVSRREHGPAAGHAASLALIGVGALLLGAGLATVQRRRGQAVPGGSVAVGAGLLLAALGAFPRHLPLHPTPFPVAEADWPRATAIWEVLALLAVGCLLLATTRADLRAGLRTHS